MSALERDYRDLHELVDGQRAWSHRKRLHALENNDRAAILAAEALKAHHESRNNRAVRFREWGAFVLAVVAIVVSHFHL